MFTPLPMRMEFTSPRITELNHILQSLPITTSPIIVALSAKKQFSPIAGVNPLTDFIKATRMLVCLPRDPSSKCWKTLF